MGERDHSPISFIDWWKYFYFWDIFVSFYIFKKTSNQNLKSNFLISIDNFFSIQHLHYLHPNNCERMYGRNNQGE